MIIRWLGAYGKGPNLETSLNWELTQEERKLLAAEKLVHGRSFMDRSKVGLLVRNTALHRKFRGDVYSVPTKTGRLRKNRPQLPYGTRYFKCHDECFVAPDYIGIVVRGRQRAVVWDTLHEVSRKFKMPIFRLCKDGRLTKL